MHISRRDFIKTGTFLCLSSLLGYSTNIITIAADDEKEFEIVPVKYTPYDLYFSDKKPIVSIVKIPEKWSKEKGIEYAVQKAIDLIGGMNQVAKEKERVLLKPNLVSPSFTDTTKPQVIETLAKLLKKSGKEVSIGEGSAVSIRNINMSIGGYVCCTKDHQILEGIQNDVFTRLGYNELSKKIDVPLVNLHVGKMVKMDISDNFVFKKIYIHEALYNSDLICSVPMMKTHGLANVTLSLKNVGIGGFPGLIYGTVRSEVHREATKVDPTGTSSVTVDMVKANKIGLSIIDATTAMQGQGPSLNGGGKLVEMNLIIASTNALAADMVAANVMGFESNEIDTFQWAWKAGMKPSKIDDIEVVGGKLAEVRKQFERPRVAPYTMLKDWYGPPCKEV